MELPVISRSRRWRPAAACCALLLLAHAAPAHAGPVTDPVAFLNAVALLPGSQATLDFDALPVGSSPDGQNGIQFQFNGDANGAIWDIVVTNTFDTTSPFNYLGIDDDGGSGVFLALDDWEMTFKSPLLALGMFFVTNPDGLLEGDVVIQTSAGSVSNSAEPFTTLGDGGAVYFLGLITDGTSFSGATIGYGPDVTDIFFEYNVDDITTVRVVPEPSSMALGSMLLAAFWARRRSTRKNDIKE